MRFKWQIIAKIRIHNSHMSSIHQHFRHQEEGKKKLQVRFSISFAQLAEHVVENNFDGCGALLLCVVALEMFTGQPS